MNSSNLHIGPDKAELFDRVADGDQQAFRELFEQFSRKFYGAAFRMSGSHYLAEEIVQETFIRVWAKRSKFKGLENPVGYLHTVFYRCISQRYREDAATRKAEGRLIDMPYQDDLSREEVYALEKRYQQLDEAVSMLAPQQAQVFHLIKKKGLSRDEAARQLNLSPNTVRNHLADAIKALKKFAQATIVIGMLLLQWIKK